MVALSSPVCDFGWMAPDFSLPGVDGQTHSLASVRGKTGFLLMFICNHCPYVQAILPRLVTDCRALQAAGVGVAAIMSNDVSAYPEDSFERMTALSRALDFSFPYLYDESQAVARAYGAVCTPDFFGFNKKGELQYRGRFDGSGMNARAVPESAKSDLLVAMTEVANTGFGPKAQQASVGCSLKWRS
ncbi:MAG: thioredoxin family protein [Zoogloeaceae bacterium]|jgi:peroxiredoxin|nr:thioredoxin family protein [Zoogloeaceae bacterium]